METKVLLVDDHPVFRKGLRLLFEEEEDIRVVGEAQDGQSASDRARELLPDVVIMDIALPGVNGIEATRRIISESPDTKIIAMSIHSGKVFIDDMLQAGAVGYILKESAPEELIKGIHTVMKGDIFLSAAATEIVVSGYKEQLSLDTVGEETKKLTAPERELLRLIKGGETKRQIAVLLKLNKDAVDAMHRQVMEKIGVDNEAAFLERIKDSRFFEKDASASDADQYVVPIIKTKLNRPRLPSGHVHRQGLVKRLEQYRMVPLTLISAPAGYGKSTLASSWLETGSQASAWLSIDEKDNDLKVFISYFLAAIQTIFPEAVLGIQKLLKAPELPTVEHLAEKLTNELHGIGQDFILVLDDIHLVRDKKVYELLSELLRHPIPYMHLVLVGRRDPFLSLSSLRARNQIHEVRIRDMRFSAGEAAEYLEKEFDRQIKQDTAEKWTEKTEGWITGLRLAALSIRHRGDYESLLSELTGNIQYITEYLFNELLVNQPPEIGNYMMSSSIVDRFCAPLCEALVGKDNAPDGHDIDGWQFIGILRKENLFAINLDAGNYWFRFHHMFQFLLQNQLKRHRSGSDIAELHSRASKWFFENNLIEDGLRHAIAAGDMIGAAVFVEKNRQSIQNTDKWYVLKNWLELLPDSLISQRPELLLAHAWVLLKQFKVLEIMPVMDLVDPLLADNPEETALYGEVDYYRGVCNYFFGNGAISLKHFKRALKKIPINHHDTRSQTELMYGSAAQMAGEKDKAVHMLNGLLHGAQPLHNLRKIRIHLSLVFMHIISGDLEDAIHANQRSMDVSTRNFFACEIAWSNYLQGIIHFQRNELDEAIECFNQAKKERYILNTRAAIDCIAGLSLAYQLKQQPEKADTELDVLFDFVAYLKDTAHKFVADSCRVRLSLMQEDLETTIRCIENSFPPDIAAMGFWIEIPAVTRCRALIYEGSDSSMQTAEKELNEYLKLNQSHHNICRQIDILILLALVYKKQKRDDNALDSLGQAVIYAAPGGCMRAFIEPGPQMVELLEALIQRKVEVEFIKSLLAFHRGVKQTAATGFFDKEEKSLHRVSADIQPMVAPLTNREIDILSNLSKRLSNKEIAEKLFISPETVKRHTINIYRKLDTHNRQEAVTKAQALMII